MEEVVLVVVEGWEMVDVGEVVARARGARRRKAARSFMFGLDVKVWCNV